MKNVLNLMIMIACLIVVGLMSGCASGPLSTDMMSNKVACATDKSEAFMVSKYGPIGIATVLSAEMAGPLCGAAPAAAVAK